MRKRLLCILLLPVSLFAQNLDVTFTAADETSAVDSVQATNLTTDESIIFPGNETLILGQSAGLENTFVPSSNIELSPNPFSSSVNLSFNNPLSGNIAITIRNLLGQELFQHNEYAHSGRQSFILSMNDPGVFFVSISGPGINESVKAIHTGLSQHGFGVYNSVNEVNGVPGNKAGELSSGLEYRLAYSLGQTMHYKCYSGSNTSIITDSPTSSINYSVEFIKCTDEDGGDYEIVKIGGQMWMAENLAYLPFVGVQDGSDFSCAVYRYGTGLVSEAKETINYQKYGVLYDVGLQADICPDGWQIPNKEDYEILIDYNGSKALTKLKSKSNWPLELTGDNASGFNALPAGSRGERWTFHGIGEWASFCIGSISDNGYWLTGGLIIDNDLNHLGYYNFDHSGYSVRCIHNTEIQTIHASRISSDSAESGGVLSLISEESIVSSGGVCWSTLRNPTILDDRSNDSIIDGKIKSEMLGLAPGNRYYVRAYVISSSGQPYYGNEVTFKTADGSFIDARDGREYSYVTIGKQNWMSENLAYLPKVDWKKDSSSTQPRHYVYDYNHYNVAEALEMENYKTFGVLYNWPAAVNECPDGWHLPSDEEWKIVELYLGMNDLDLDRMVGRNSGNVGLKLRSIFWRQWNEKYDGDFDRVGFNALPGGRRIYDSNFLDLNENFSSGAAFFWSSTPTSSIHSDEEAFFRSIGHNQVDMERRGSNLDQAFSVRCVKSN